MIREHAPRLAARISDAEWELLASLPAPWRASKFAANHAPEPRREIHREALVALAGIVDGGPMTPGHTSDGLTSLAHLYYDLDPAHLTRVRDSYIAVLSTELGSDALSPTVRSLFAEFEDARAFLDAIWNQEAAPFSPAWFEQDAKFRYGTILTSFNRKDIFEFLGEQTVRWLREQGLVSPATRALEIGCGSGRIVKALAPLVASVHAVDRSEGMLDVARQHCDGLSNVTWLQNDGVSLPVGDGQVELVYSFIVFSYIPDLDVRLALIREAHRVLAPGGHLVITHNDVSTDMEAFARSLGFTVEMSQLDDDRWAFGSLRRGPQWVGRFRK